MPGTTQEMPVAAPEPEVAVPPAAIDDDGLDDLGADLDEEDDWQFNEDLPSLDEPGEPAGEPLEVTTHSPDPNVSSGNALEGMDDLEGGDSFELDDAGLDLGGSLDLEDQPVSDPAAIPQPAVAPTPPPAPAPAAVADPFAPPGATNEPAPGFGGERDEGAFGSVDDFSSLMEPDENEAAAPVSAPTAPAVASAEVDEAESWDFFSDGGEDGSFSSLVDGAGGGAGHAPVAPTATNVGNALDRSATPTSTPIPQIEERQGKSILVLLGMVLGWTFTLGLAVFGIGSGVLQSFDEGSNPPSFVDVGSMRAAGISGSWIETARLGTLYAVKGHLDNPGTRPAAPGVGLEATLLDAQGRPLEIPSARVGSDWSLDSLREISESGLELAEQSASSSLAWREIPAGGSTPFVAIFRAVPDDATQFSLRVVEALAPPVQRFDVGNETAVPAADSGLDETARAAAEDAPVVPGAAPAAPVN